MRNNTVKCGVCNETWHVDQTGKCYACGRIVCDDGPVCSYWHPTKFKVICHYCINMLIEHTTRDWFDTQRGV